jgi:hypothetical protein
MRKLAVDVAKRRQERKERKERQRELRAQERQAQADVGRSSPIRSGSSIESLGLVSPDSEDLGYLLGDEAVEEREEEVTQRSPKRLRTDAGPSTVIKAPLPSRKGWMYWLGSSSGSGSGEGQTQTAPISSQARAGPGGQVQTMPAVSQVPASAAPRPSEGVAKRFTRRRTVAR